MTNSFVAFDVETANPNVASICQAGLVTYENGKIVEEWGTLVNPNDAFDWFHVMLHGIDQEKVKDAPTLCSIFPQMRLRLENRIVISHMPFDRNALFQASFKYSLPQITCTWLDSAAVARHAWPECAAKGYGLRDLSKKLGIAFKHHDATEDARAAGQIIIHAINATGIDIAGWLKCVNEPIRRQRSDKLISGRPKPNDRPRAEVNSNPDGALAGEEVVFTGSLSIARKRAEMMAKTIGCRVGSSVRRTTTMLVVGDEDITKLAGHDKSVKHRRAEELMATGQHIRILREYDFMQLVRTCS